MFATLVTIMFVCAFFAAIIYNYSDDDTPGGVGGGGFSTDRPRQQSK